MVRWRNNLIQVLNDFNYPQNQETALFFNATDQIATFIIYCEINLLF